jgi:Protein of unknown function (DUF3047)
VSLKDFWARLGLWRLCVVLVVLAGAVAVLTVPRLRAFYFGPAGRPGVAVARAVTQPAATTTPTDATGRKTGQRPVLPDADGRIRVRVSDRAPQRLPADGVPVGWTAKEFVGQASVELVRDEARLALRLRSEHSSFALYRDVVVDLNEFPFLSWAWKVVRLPADGDVRERATDDQAAQVYVIFPRWPWPLKSSDVIGYVWDSRAPVGTQLTSTKAANVKIIVVASGRREADTWRVEQRDVAKDYVALFGRQPPRVGEVAVMIDTNDTRGVAEALIGDLVFARTRAESMESPTSMLR